MKLSMKVDAAKGLSTVDEMPKKMEKPPKVDPMDDHEAQGHYDTLMRAHQIMNDPVKLKKVRAIAGRKALAATALTNMVAEKPVAPPKINSIADLKNTRNAMRMKKADPDGDND